MMKEIFQTPELKELLNATAQKAADIIGKTVSIHLKVHTGIVNWEQIQTAVCESCGVSWEDVKSASRDSKYVLPRQLYCWFAVTYLRATVTDVGKSINRDHTTVIHSRATVRNMMETKNERYVVPFNMIEMMLDQRKNPNDNEVKIN